MNKIFKFMITILSLMFISFLISSNMVLAESENKNKEQKSIIKEFVTVEKAKMAIGNYIDRNEYLEDMWNKDINFKFTLYDIDDSVIAYYFSVDKGKDNIGYFIISANKKIDPLLEHGFGKDKEEEFKREIVKENNIYYI